jgi:hypothetical protein
MKVSYYKEELCTHHRMMRRHHPHINQSPVRVRLRLRLRVPFLLEDGYGYRLSYS